MDLNRTSLIGRVVKDPETKTTPNGQNVSSFSLATNKVWKDTNGEKKEKVEFHNLVAWRNLADIASKYIKKGMKLYVEGELQTRSWDDPNGVKRYRTEIVVSNMIMLDKVEQSTQPEAPKAEEVEEEISVEDIPF